MGTGGGQSPLTSCVLERLRRAVVAHADAEEHQELPKLAGAADETQLARMQHALSRVQGLAVRDARPGETFSERRGPNGVQAQFLSGAGRGKSLFDDTRCDSATSVNREAGGDSMLSG